MHSAVVLSVPTCTLDGSATLGTSMGAPTTTVMGAAFGMMFLTIGKLIPKMDCVIVNTIYLGNMFDDCLVPRYPIDVLRNLTWNFFLMRSTSGLSMPYKLYVLFSF